MIPEAAVEAAARSLFENHPISKGHQPWSAEWGDGRVKTQFRADARAALEAAAPHMQRYWPSNWIGEWVEARARDKSSSCKWTSGCPMVNGHRGECTAS